MKQHKQFPICQLRRLLRYDAETGKLFWLLRLPDMFKGGFRDAAGNANNWNSRYAGKEAFTTTSPHGYKQGAIYGSNYQAHRVCWAIHYGYWPHEIDHIDGDRSANRIDNLRDISRAGNCRNLGWKRDNISGRVGVVWFPATGKWRAQGYVNRKAKALGYFERLEDAVACREQFERENGYHPNHGKRPPRRIEAEKAA